MAAKETDRTFHAYELTGEPDMPLLTAPLSRDWMDETPQRYAYRCLPLSIANQAGWVILNPVTFSACWNGGPGREDVAVTHAAAAPDPRVSSHFGAGVVTIAIPYLFRTPPMVNLWIKGPTNLIKDGAQALEGIIETDWVLSSFTMNWKLTRPHHPVRFERGEPICMLVPVARGLAEELEPRLSPIQETPTICEQYLRWRNERGQFLEALDRRDPEAVARGWQRDYMKGLRPDGQRVREHQTRLRLREFTRITQGAACFPASTAVESPREASMLAAG
jgi:uncharacterized protein DUF6065